ncbi:Serine/threonine-protein phosphatase 6 regulatory ankyrin repeat subunit B, partial [Madurella mycetomatis]
GGRQRIQKHERTEFETALHDAAHRDSLKIVKKLLDAGFDPNQSVNGSGTPLQAAVAGHHKQLRSRDGAAVVQLLVNRGADVNAPGGRFGTALDAAKDNDSHGLEEFPRGRGVFKINSPRATQESPSMAQVDATLARSLSLPLPLSLMSHTKHFINIVLTLSMVLTTAFVEMIKIARGDQGRATQELPVNPFYKSCFKWCIALLITMIASLVNLIMENRTEDRKGYQRPRLLHAADTASSKLRLMTSAGLQILSDAIQNGDGDIVSVLSASWVGTLRHASFPGEASDKMAEMLVQCHAKEVEALFKDSAMEEADLVLTLNNLVERHYLVDYAELEHFLRRLLRDFTTGFPYRDWKVIKRLGPAMAEILIGVVADKSPHVAHVVSQVITEGW